MFKRGVAILLVAFASITAAFAQYDLDHFYYSGRQSLIDGKYAQAIESFNILSHLDSTIYEAYFFRGIAKSNLGDFVGAILNFLIIAIVLFFVIKAMNKARDLAEKAKKKEEEEAAAEAEAEPEEPKPTAEELLGAILEEIKKK